MIKRVHSTFYWAKEMDASFAFYRDVLGLQAGPRYGEDWAEFAVDGARIALHGTRGAPPPGAGATVVFEVDDLDASIRMLRGRNVEFEGDVTEVPDGGRFASFRDPAGNLLQIFEAPAREGSS